MRHMLKRPVSTNCIMIIPTAIQNNIKPITRFISIPPYIRSVYHMLRLRLLFPLFAQEIIYPG